MLLRRRIVCVLPSVVSVVTIRCIQSRRVCFRNASHLTIVTSRLHSSPFSIGRGDAKEHFTRHPFAVDENFIFFPRFIVVSLECAGKPFVVRAI